MKKTITILSILIALGIYTGVKSVPQAPTLYVYADIKVPAKLEKKLPKLEYIMTKKHADILIIVYLLESTFGKNDGCKSDGQFNGYGFGQSTHVWNCFDTFEEVTDKVNAWFETQLKTKTLPEALCYYNRGVAVDDCPYYKKYLSLIE